MPIVTHHRALVLPSSPPTSPVGGRTNSNIQETTVVAATPVPALTDDAPTRLHHHRHHHLLLVPFEIKNGCSEEGLVVESDNIAITNAIRKHYLVHFGHRDLEALVQEYQPNAVMVHQHNLVLPTTADATTTAASAEQPQKQQQHRSSFHGQDQIRSAFRDIFEMHPTVDSTFQLKEIVVHNNGRTARVGWSATTPTHKFAGGYDTFQFDAHGKIAKQVVICQVEHLTSPWYQMDE
jgi:hypothetical protein